MAIAMVLFEDLPAHTQLVRPDPGSAFEQGELGGQVMTLQHFDASLLRATKAHIINAPIWAWALQPDAVHSGGLEEEWILASLLSSREQRLRG
jgi:hypothetical protein